MTTDQVLVGIALLSLLCTVGGSIVALAYRTGRNSVRIDRLEDWQNHVQRKYFEARTTEHGLPR